MIILFVVVEWNNRFKENHFQVKNSWLKWLAIATIVALGTFSDYKEFIYFSLKLYSTNWYEKIFTLF
jgi:hypothetical protein